MVHFQKLVFASMSNSAEGQRDSGETKVVGKNPLTRSFLTA